VLAVLDSRVRDWVVMTDELQYAKLATHIGETLSPLPTLRGAHFAAYAQLYPAVIAPFYGTMSAPGAFRAAHVLNGILFASAAVPVYLLARRAALSRAWSVTCAALALAIPWNVDTAFVMSEAVAYPVFAWALLAVLRAVEAPSARRDLVALAVIALAVLARTQFLSLALVFVVAALLVERRGHRVLWIATGVGIVLAFFARSHVLGSYAVTAKGFPFPWRAFEQLGAHLDVVGVGMALLPLLLGGSWLVAHAPRRNAFAVVASTAIVVLALETSSYDARFGGGLTGIRSRYVFYVAPLLLIATVCALAERRLHRRALIAVTAFVVLTTLAHGFPRVAGLYVDAPDAVLNDVIQDSGGRWFVALAVLVLALALLLVRWPPRALAVAAVALIAAGSLATSAYAWTRLLQSRGPSSREIAAKPTVVYNWVDSVLPSGAHAAIVPYADNPSWGPNAILWWDVEFWNRSVDAAYVIGSTWDYAPFPHTQLRIDPRSGVVRGTEHAPPYVVMSQTDARFGLAAISTPGVNYGLQILSVDRPYRATWFSSGLDPDGWTEPGRIASVHVIGGGSAKVTVVSAKNVAKTFCAKGDIALPTKATGTQPPLPLGPGLQSFTDRTVGVRLVAVQPGPACAR
jgi:hypothetical protein